MGEFGAAAVPQDFVPRDDGEPGTGEELAQTLEKVVSQLDILSRTLSVLESRVSMNEGSVDMILNHFNELKE